MRNGDLAHEPKTRRSSTRGRLRLRCGRDTSRSIPLKRNEMGCDNISRSSSSPTGRRPLAVFTLLQKSNGIVKLSSRQQSALWLPFKAEKASLLPHVRINVARIALPRLRSRQRAAAPFGRLWNRVLLSVPFCGRSNLKKIVEDFEPSGVFGQLCYQLCLT